jgi:uncharacterized membrane protein
MMYSTRIAPVVVPVAAGLTAFGNWTVAVLSILGLLVLLLAVRSIRLRGSATGDDRLTGSHGA